MKSEKAADLSSPEAMRELRRIVASVQSRLDGVIGVVESSYDRETLGKALRAAEELKRDLDSIAFVVGWLPCDRSATNSSGGSIVGRISAPEMPTTISTRRDMAIAGSTRHRGALRSGLS